MGSERKCSKCQATVDDGQRFCTHCGQPVDLATATGTATKIYVIAGILALLIFVAIKWTRQEEVTPAPGQPVHQQAKDDHDHEAGLSDHDRQHLKGLRKMAANNDPEALIDLAEFLYGLGSKEAHLYQECIATFNRILAIYPKHSYSLRSLGNTFFEAGKHEQAIKAYTRYLTLNPDDLNVWTDLGTQYFYAKKNERAIQSYQRAIKLDPLFYNAHFNLHLVYKRVGNIEKSEEHRATADLIKSKSGEPAHAAMEHARIPGEGDRGVLGDAVVPTKATLPVQSSGSVPDQGLVNLEQYFRNHHIIGSKFVSFTSSEGKAELRLRNFPVRAMPPNARAVFDSKIMVELIKLTKPLHLTLVDHGSGDVMLEYDTP